MIENIIKKNIRIYSLAILMCVVCMVAASYIPRILGDMVNVLAFENELGVGFFHKLGFLLFFGFLLILSTYQYRKNFIELYGTIYAFLRTAIFKSLLEPDCLKEQAISTHSILKTSNYDVLMIQRFVNSGSIIVINIILIILVYYQVFRIDKTVFLSLLTIMPLIMIFGRSLNEKIGKVGVSKNECSFGITKIVNESMDGQIEIRSFGRQESQIEKFSDISKAYLLSEVNMSKIRAKYEPSNEVVVAAAQSIVLVYGGISVLRGEINVGNLISLSMYILVLTYPFLILPSIITFWKEAEISDDNISKLVYSPGPDVNQKKYKALDQINEFSITDMEGEIFVGRFERVAIESEKIENSKKIEEIIKINDGESKMVSVNGVNISQYNIQDLNQCTVVLSCDEYLIDDSILNNVTMYGEYENDKFRRSILSSGVSEFIENLPDGVNTIIGEKGKRLSGGQRQRLCLARALYHEPSLLIINDAIGFIDEERRVAILAMLSDRKLVDTIIYITRDPMVMNNVDRIA